MSRSDCRSFVFVAICLLATFATAHAQTGGVTWGAGNGAGAGAWSNAQAGGPGMHPPGPLGSTDQQISYGYAGIDSRGPYGGAGGNGGYYVSGTDEHGRPFTYNGGIGPGGQPMPMPGQPGYPGNSYGYRAGASAALASIGIVACAMALLATSS
ncbi:hypothetical protein KR222_009526 [Zaprionus bogoriensis]|nr:hypothetical protein KR222_009526 [Zaprionus bogoriensis]